MYNITKNKLLPLLLACAPIVPAIGCATAQPPQELVDARAAYVRAQQSHAADLSPASLHSAKEALDGAEKRFENDGPSVETRDSAYVALRKSQLAEADGSIAYHKQQLEASHRNAETAQQRNAQMTQAELARTKEQLAKESDARAEAERRAKEAFDKLSAANAAVTQEPRGTVITLPGNVLFASGKAMLLPGAQTSLNQVADALKDQPTATITVEGHTDSTGSDVTNMALSQARAESVGNYLVSRGVPKEQVTTTGLGPSRPVAENTTPEGRANNRRVEIIVKQGEPR
jgi:outer membrane protein OmpA-like peptidoglycan-associated protein